LLIGAINIAIGFCTYRAPRDPERIVPVLPPLAATAREPGELGLGEVPAVVMRAFAVAVPRVFPVRARKLDVAGATRFELTYRQAGVEHRCTLDDQGNDLRC